MQIYVEIKIIQMKALEAEFLFLQLDHNCNRLSPCNRHCIAISLTCGLPMHLLDEKCNETVSDCIIAFLYACKVHLRVHVTYAKADIDVLQEVSYLLPSMFGFSWQITIEHELKARLVEH